MVLLHPGPLSVGPCSHPATTPHFPAPRRSALEAALSHERFIAVYLSVKEYSCCDVLNWWALFIAKGMGLALTMKTKWEEGAVGMM